MRLGLHAGRAERSEACYFVARCRIWQRVRAGLRPFLFALFLFTVCGVQVRAENAVAIAQNSKPFVGRTEANDSAIMRAREFLETPGVAFGIVNVLHWKSFQTGVTFVNEKESGTGATLKYTYTWVGADHVSSGSDTVTFQCDSMGMVDRVVEVSESGERAFARFSSVRQV